MYETIATIKDEVLARRVTLCLLTRGLCGAEQVAIKAAGGTVILCGELASRESKLECLECCRHVAGVVRVVDQLRLSAATKNVPSTRVED
jgi:osmotically-inducible protein OsmY